MRVPAKTAARKALRESTAFRDMDRRLAHRLVDELAAVYLADPHQRDMGPIAGTYLLRIAGNPWGETPEGFDWYARTLPGVAV
jgi:hypothetical protein